MKPHPQIRKTIKWGGAAVTVLLVVVWIGSGWWSPILYGSHWFFGAVDGRLFIIREIERDPATGFNIRFAMKDNRDRYQLRWSFGSTNGLNTRKVYVPLWSIVIPVVTATALAFHLDALARRRARLGLCPKCHYDRTGLAANAVCPECGAPPAPTIQNSIPKPATDVPDMPR